MRGEAQVRDEHADEEDAAGDEGAGSSAATRVIQVWERPKDERDPPSQRPEDTHEEDRRRRRVG